MIRTFVAVELDVDLRALVAQAQNQIKERLMRALPRMDKGIRIQWVRPDSIHLTLKFLGKTEGALIECIREALTPVVSRVLPFSVDVERVGIFPDLRSPRVLWLGLSGPVETLVHLAADVDAALHSLGFPREERPFSPHLTMARIKEQSRAVGKAVAGSGMVSERLQVGNLHIRTVSLIKSELRPTGAVYARLWEIPLGPSSVPL